MRAAWLHTSPFSHGSALLSYAVCVYFATLSDAAPNTQRNFILRLIVVHKDSFQSGAKWVPRTSCAFLKEILSPESWTLIFYKKTPNVLPSVWKSFQLIAHFAFNIWYLWHFSFGMRVKERSSMYRVSHSGTSVKSRNAWVESLGATELCLSYQIIYSTNISLKEKVCYWSAYTYPTPTLHLPYTYPTPTLHLPCIVRYNLNQIPKTCGKLVGVWCFWATTTKSQSR